jgi:tRNA dimethylallyltransferase
VRTKVAALVGPTAVGKTTASILVAEALSAEIVSVDSMQIYRGMDVGTAKATPEMLERVPHHLIDIRDPEQPITVAEFQSLARDAIAEVDGRGRLPLLVGGSGLYFRSVVDDLDFPPRSLERRAALEDEADRIGPEALHARLSEIDPAAAARIEPANARRTIRALEVIAETGRPFSENDSWERFQSRYVLAVAGITLDRAILYARVAARVDAMMAAGLVDETRSLDLGATARQALGYRQVLEAADAPPDEIRDEIVRATKRFARRQESWFRSDPRVKWFDASEPALVEDLVAFFKSSLALP